MNMTEQKTDRTSTQKVELYNLTAKIETQGNMSWVHVESPGIFIDVYNFLLRTCHGKSPTTAQINIVPPQADGIISYNNYINKVFAYRIDRNTEEGDVEYKRVFKSVEKKVQQASDKIVLLNFKSLRGKMDEFKNKMIFIHKDAVLNVYNNAKPIFGFFLFNRDDIKNDTYKNKVIPNHFQTLVHLLMRDFINSRINYQSLYRSFSKKVRKNDMHTYNIVSISEWGGKNNLSFNEIDGMPSFTFVFDYDTFFVYVYPYLSKSKINYDTVFNDAPFKPPFRLACLAEPSAFPLLMWLNNDTLMLKLEFLK